MRLHWKRGRSLLAKGDHSFYKRKHFNAMRGHSMFDSNDHHHFKRKHFKGMKSRFMSHSDDDHHYKKKHFKGMRGSSTSGSSTSDSDDDHHRNHPQHHEEMMHHRKHHHGGMMHHGRHPHHHGGMMHHHNGKHGKKGHGRGFFSDDSALVPICATNVDISPAPLENEETGDQPIDTAELVDDGAKTREQGTQTTGIMEIVIEDQEALSAAIRIVNKFL